MANFPGTFPEPLYVSVAQVDSLSAGETTLASFTIPEDALVRDGDMVQVEALVTFAATGNSKQVKVKTTDDDATPTTITVYDSTSKAQNGGQMAISFFIARISAGNQAVWGTAVASGSLFGDDAFYSAITSAGGIRIEITGSALIANADISCRAIRATLLSNRR